jgi:hypothetical protein
MQPESEPHVHPLVNLNEKKNSIQQQSQEQLDFSEAERRKADSLAPG